MKEVLLQEGILSSSDIEENVLWANVPKEMLESTALEASQRYVVFLEPPAVCAHGIGAVAWYFRDRFNHPE